MKIKGKRIVALATALAMTAQPVMAMAEETTGETAEEYAEDEEYYDGEYYDGEYYEEGDKELYDWYFDQTLGELSDITVKTIDGKGSYWNNIQNKILDSNNRLWTLGSDENPEEDVKDYVANWIYWGDKDDADYVRYTLYMDETLWNSYDNDTKSDIHVKLADDVVRFDGRYALSSEGVLHNVYNTNDKDVAQVADWISPDRYSGAVYVLKTDGSLWTRNEVKAGEAVNEFTLLDTDVKQILEDAYLKNDGTVKSYDGTIGESKEGCTVDKLVEVSGGSGYCDIWAFYGTDGNFYYMYYKPTTQTYDYVNLGKIDVKEICAPALLSYTYVLAADGTLYRITQRSDEENPLEVLASNVEEISRAGLLQYHYDGYDTKMWSFKCSDGTYLYPDGTVMSGNIVLEGNDYNGVILYEDGTTGYESSNHGKELSDVKQLISDYYVLRTDGTVWRVRDCVPPEKVADLNVLPVTTGDVNGDNDVNISDLMMVLNHVSGKSTLTGNAFTAGDVTGDGKVDLQDLMRILNFVSGKSKTL